MIISCSASMRRLHCILAGPYCIIRLLRVKGQIIIRRNGDAEYREQSEVHCPGRSGLAHARTEGEGRQARGGS